MIELHNVRFAYPKKKVPALQGISLSVASGEVFALLGPNGAGKTTLIRVIAGLIQAGHGQVRLCGLDISRNECEARRRLGMVLGDERTFYFRLSGAQNLEFFGGLSGLGPRDCVKKVEQVLEMVGLRDDATLQYMRYSTGMKKRLNLARALLRDPDVYLLDEPNSGVDPHSARSIRNIILDLKRRGKAILLTTHDMEEAEKLADRIGFLRDGSLVAIGGIDSFRRLVNARRFEVRFEVPLTTNDVAVLTDLVSSMRSLFVGNSVELRDGVLEVRYNGPFDLNQALQLIASKNLRVRQVSTVEASLEDVFIKLME